MQENSTLEHYNEMDAKMALTREASRTNGQVNFPNLETRQEKLERKRKRREMDYKSTGEKLVLANLSKNHPHYGMSPAEHLRAKRNPCAEILL